MTVGEVRLGLIGLGTVGTGVIQLLERNHDAIARKLGRSLRLVRVASRSLDTKPHPDLGHARLSTDPWTVVHDPEVEVVIELIGFAAIAAGDEDDGEPGHRHQHIGQRVIQSGAVPCSRARGEAEQDEAHVGDG